MFSRKEVKTLLPVNVLSLTDLKPNQWVSIIHSKLEQVEHLSVILSKIKFLGTSISTCYDDLKYS